MTDLQALIANAISEALKPLNDSVTKLHNEVSSLIEQVEELNEELCKKDSEITRLESLVRDGLDEREQYSRRNNLRLFGVKETQNEDTDQLVLQVAEKLKVPLLKHHIDRSHRVGKAGDNPRPIIVKFVSYAQRRDMFLSKKLLKGSQVTIREDLTRARLDLLKGAVSKYSTKAVWSSDGVVMVNVGKPRPFRVKTESDLKKLLQMHPPASDES